MNNDLWVLLKYKVINDFKLNKVGKKAKGDKPTGDSMKKRGLIYLFVGIIIVFYVVMYFDLFYQDLAPKGLESYILPIFMLLTVLIVFMYSVRLTENVLFKSKDYELLAGMPIKSSTVLTSKLIYLMSITYFFALIIMIPAGILMVNAAGLSLTYLLLVFLIALMLPIVPVIVGAILSMIIGYVATKFKYTDFITSIVLIILLVAFIMFPSMATGDMMESYTQESFEQILSYYYPAKMARDVLADNSVIDLVIYLGSNMLLFIAFVFAVGKLYAKLNQKLTEKVKAEKFKGKVYKQRSPFGAMLQKEFKKLITTSAYLINTCFGYFILLGFALLTFFVKDFSLVQVLSDPAMAGYRVSIIVMMISAICAFSSTTGSSISLEGKQLWIYKTLPVDPLTVLNSKLALNLVIGIPCIIIVSGLFAISFGLGLIPFIVGIIVPTTFLTATAVFGLLMNLKYPWFDFESEVYVIKRSMASMLSIFVPMFLAIILLIIAMCLPFNQILVFLILGVFMALVTLVLYEILRGWGIKKFNQL